MQAAGRLASGVMGERDIKIEAPERPQSTMETFYGKKSPPTKAEAVIVASLILQLEDEARREKWVKATSEELDAFGEDGGSWRPSCSKGPWDPQYGIVYTILEGTGRYDENVLEQCAKAVDRFGMPKPSTSSIRAYLAKLIGKQLPFVHTSGISWKYRNAWVLMAAAKLVTEEEEALMGLRMPTQLRLSKREMREAKGIVKQAQQAVDMALNRAHKAETKAATARSIADEAVMIARAAQDRAHAAEEHKKVAMQELEVLRYALTREREAEERACEAEKRELKALKELDALRAAVQNLSDENDKLRARCSRAVTSAQQELIEKQQVELEELRQRRANNMGATRELNLERQRSRRAQAQVEELRKTIQENWGKDVLGFVDDAKKLLPTLSVSIAVLQDELKVMEKQHATELCTLGKIIKPPVPMERGAYDARTRFTVMKLIAIANVCVTRVTSCFLILADYYGVQLPERERNILVSAQGGVRKYEKKMVKWVPQTRTCMNIRFEMGPMAQIEVGEYIIANQGSKGNFGLHMDGASSEGRELHAFVLGHRQATEGRPSRIRNLLLDINWSIDKTSATRASDFRSVCKTVAQLCNDAGMHDTSLIEELQPSGCMNDRASSERAAARLITGSNENNSPTCGEHGALVNPLSACTKAMDKVVLGWMGKTDADSKLDEHKVKALNMAVGWNSSPSGALIYSVCKYGATHSDKGYAVGQEARAYNEYLANQNAADREAILVLGHMEDLLAIKGSRSYIGPLDAPIVDRILEEGPGSFHIFLKEQEALAKPGGGRIRKQILAGAASPQIRSCVRAEAIIGDFFMWPIMRAIKYRPPDGSDPHILDMAPIYQEAYENLKLAAACPRLVATNQLKLLPSSPHLYPRSAAGIKTKDERITMDMERIYQVCENCEHIEELLKAGLDALANTFFKHTIELQKDGCLTGENDTPELRQKLAGINRTNTVVESVFALEKFLSTREKGSSLLGRRGWTLFKYNHTFVWGETLTSGKLALYMQASRREAHRQRHEAGTERQQLANFFAHKADARNAELEKIRKRAADRQAAEERLRDPALRVKTFSGLTKLQNPELIEQLKIRKLVDKRAESSGRPLVITPPSSGGRSWLVLKLQELLKLEYREKIIDEDPNDLRAGDLGCDSRAPRKKHTVARVSNGPRSQGSKRGKKRKERDAEWDDEQETWPVECILDSRVATTDDLKAHPNWQDVGVEVGEILYLVAWEGWDPSYNSWEPYAHIADDDLIADYEERAAAAEDQVEDEAAAIAEEQSAVAELSRAEAEVNTVEPNVGAGARQKPQQRKSSETGRPSTCFKTEIASCLPTAIVEAMVSLESNAMTGLERCSAQSVAEVVKRWDRMATWAESPDGELLGFAISSSEGRGKNAKLSVWELHVKTNERRKGIATALMDLVQMKSSFARARGSVMLELQVHATNEVALSFCQGYGLMQLPQALAGPVVTLCRKQ